jgi:hypothetical protein
MSCRDEAEALRDKIDDLAQRSASVDDWKLLDAQLYHALVEGQIEINTLQSEMIALVKSSKPNWCWFQTHQSLRELREVLDDLRVLRMCVQSRIYELDAGANQAAL